MKSALILLTLLAFVVPAEAATIYKWVDKDEVFHFTDDRNKAPSVVEKEIVEDSLETKTSTVQAMVSPGKEEAGTEAYGGNETWLKGKMEPWERRLEEATSNYMKIREELLKSAEWLPRHRLEGKTQFQMLSYDLARLSKQLEAYRAEISEAKEMLERLSRELPAPPREEAAATRKAVSPKDAEETKTDLLGRDEAWWRGKVRHRKEELEEATKGYGKAENEVIKKVEGMGPSTFGGLSLTQYQMISNRLTILNEEKEKYGARIAEANEMLRKLSKEAEESKANPEWLK